MLITMTLLLYHQLRDNRSILQHLQQANWILYSTNTRVRSHMNTNASLFPLLFMSNLTDTSGDILADGTIKFCQDLEVDPEDVVLLAIAFELKSPRIGQWTKQGWTDGWKSLRYASPTSRSMSLLAIYHNRCDSIPAMKETLPRLRTRLANDPEYFQKVYIHTFNFARSDGQRSLGKAACPSHI